MVVITSIRANRRANANDKKEWKVVAVWILVTLHVIYFRVVGRFMDAVLELNQDAFVNVTALRGTYRNETSTNATEADQLSSSFEAKSSRKEVGTVIKVN